MKDHRKPMAIKVLMFVFLVALSLSLAVPAAIAQVNAKKAAEIAKDMLDNYLFQGVTSVVSGETTVESGLYRVPFKINGTAQSVYLTQDAKFLIFPTNMVDIAVFKEKILKSQQPQALPKSDKPLVELYVMSLCPYGVKAEQTMLPLVKAFGDKIDFAIKYIVNVEGETIDKVDSLHGPKEVVEDVREEAIRRYYPDKFLAYLGKIQEKACLISCGDISIDTYWKTAAKKVAIDPKKIESFVYSDEAMALLKQNAADSQKYGATASPTLLINGEKSEAVYNGPQAAKQAICSAFTASPQQCQQ